MNNIFGQSQNDLFNNKGLFSNNSKQNNNFKINNQEDEEHICMAVNDELSQIRESENESQSGTESAFKSRQNSQMNMNIFRENLNLNEDKNEFLRPHDVNINKIEINNNNNDVLHKNNNNSNKIDFEDEVNKKYRLFPINI